MKNIKGSYPEQFKKIAWGERWDRHRSDLHNHSAAMDGAVYRHDNWVGHSKVQDCSHYMHPDEIYLGCSEFGEIKCN